jgi:PiT family inorganic phosphate transporter
MDLQTLYLWLAIGFGFLMACGIGANDVSNAVGTSVGSKAITIKQAILIAAIFEFLGAFIAGSEVTNTIKQNIIDINLIKQEDILILGMLASLLASGVWLFVASIMGWPVSTTHTIVGAIIGFGLMQFGPAIVKWDKVTQILLAWVLSPVSGCIISYCIFSTTQIFIFNKDKPLESAKQAIPVYVFGTIFIIVMISLATVKNIGFDINLFHKLGIATIISLLCSVVSKFFMNRLQLNADADKNFHFTNVEKLFAILMVFTACAMAFAHGSNDVANAIGPVAAIVALVKAPLNNVDVIRSENFVPIWVLLLGASGIVIGLATYGYKVIATIGNNITQLTPSRGFSATLATAITVVVASGSGLPISTTHTLVGGIFGVGLARGIAALNLKVIRSIIMSWLITVPVGALLAVAIFAVLRYLTAMFGAWAGG